MKREYKPMLRSRPISKPDKMEEYKKKVETEAKEEDTYSKSDKIE